MVGSCTSDSNSLISQSLLVQMVGGIVGDAHMQGHILGPENIFHGAICGNMGP